MIGFLVFGLCKIGICECPDRWIVGTHRGEGAMRGWGRNMRLLSAHKVFYAASAILCFLFQNCTSNGVGDGVEGCGETGGCVTGMLLGVVAGADGVSSTNGGHVPTTAPKGRDEDDDACSAPSKKQRVS